MNLLITGAWQGAQEHIAEIEAMGHQVRFLQWERDEIIDPEWVEGIICNGLFLYHPLSLFQNLKYIQLTSAGFDRVDMDEVKQRKIEIHNARGVYSTPMAEFAVAGVLNLYKRLDVFREQQERHEWKKIREIRELSGKRVVIVGCGDVGTECAKRFKAFGCEIVGVNRTVREIDSFDRVESLENIDTEIENADIVVVCIGLSDETRGIVKARKMKHDAVLVNISRGGTVDLDGAECQMVLDVFDEEPLEPESQLWDKDIITPHNSFVGEGNEDRIKDLIVGNLRRIDG
jgi:phosphoglycerate dehydrogenase-like enzyme